MVVDGNGGMVVSGKWRPLPRYAYPTYRLDSGVRLIDMLKMHMLRYGILNF